MLEAVSGAASASASAPPPEPRSPADWAREALSWASPDGLVMRAVQPIAAEALRRSGVGEGTEWGRSLQRVLDDPRSVSGFQQGFREGVWNGATSLVEGAWSLVKGVGEIAYDKNLVGEGLDLLRHHGVAVPDWAPSADRVDARMQAVGEGVGRYLAEVGRNPAKLGDDVKGWIAANWDALKADHAKAAAQGGAAEARWWGRITGRATFEVAAVAVPVTKFATVAKAGEALNLALKAGKLGETFAEAARAGKLFELWGAAAKAGKVPELVAEARQAGRLGELVAEARKATGGVETLAGRGGLTANEIGALEKAGTLSKAEATAARVTVTLREVPPAVRAALQRMTPEFRAEYAEARAAGWKKPGGETWWPPDNGGIGAHPTTLAKGYQLDRYGGESGGYLSPRGDSFDARALPQAPDPATLHNYDVAKPLRVEQAEIAPWFDKPGGGQQFRLLNPDGTGKKYKVSDALLDGYLEKK